MKILFAVQGTGNGHISRAMTLLPELCNYGKVDLLISGRHNGLTPSYPIRYKYEGLGFSLGKHGGIDLARTFTEAKISRLIKEFESVPVEKYDLVINDFEPLTAWASKVRQVPCIGLSHQSALLLPGVPLPNENNLIGNLVLKHYAPTTEAISFHFNRWHPDIFTPVIRNDLRSVKITDNGHLTVYLPAYGDQLLIEFFSQLKGVKIEIFTRGTHKQQLSPMLSLHPVDQLSFGKSMASCSGIICGAGFETPAEALFLRKKLMVIPMKNQFEQQCNAAALQQMGVRALPKLDIELLPEVVSWIQYAEPVEVNYPDQNKEVFTKLFEKSANHQGAKPVGHRTATYRSLLHAGLKELKSKAVSQFF